ncbi:beta-lactamase domain-containing protein [Pyrodictium delaneyi]|uniref:Beta-lactamase domain-containing protein n=1 Tax=Pyrodictium delaneyi TaxID=1273541 RepID=A0A0P0N3I3_9CREN|nr:MBL fold metallo-hydrolase [Pyrodictium delaneyi]ALL00962.1 beta-lactamase domain-containing protein [Pyrodictium delaneyi]OWJ55429.1 MBL fold metallo-hydrolase [Pyrodictium delaneyi]
MSPWGRASRLTILVDNRARSWLESAWGLSILVETRDTRILFDAGPSPELLCRNAERLGVSLDIDFAVLSHPHRDHYGGFPCVAEVAPGTVVYMPPSPSHVVSWIRKLGLVPVVQSKGLKAAPNAAISPALDGAGLREHALAVKENECVSVLLGCSHPGPSRLAATALRILGAEHACLAIGGLHNAEAAEVEALLELVDRIAPIHCSGRAAEYLASRKPGSYINVAAGDVIEL